MCLRWQASMCPICIPCALWVQKSERVTYVESYRSHRGIHRHIGGFVGVGSRRRTDVHLCKVIPSTPITDYRSLLTSYHPSHPQRLPFSASSLQALPIH